MGVVKKLCVAGGGLVGTGEEDIRCTCVVVVWLNSV